MVMIHSFGSTESSWKREIFVLDRVNAAHCSAFFDLEKQLKIQFHAALLNHPIFNHLPKYIAVIVIGKLFVDRDSLDCPCCSVVIIRHQE
jgi:hypothetical protein